MEINLEELGLQGAKIALSSFVASRHPVESCRQNGLPLTPNSISVLGQSQALKHFKHPNLCMFLDAQRGKGERIILASEYYNQTLTNHPQQDNQDFLLDVVGKQVLCGLDYLAHHNVVHTTLQPSNVVFKSNQEVKLFDYGLGHVTNYGMHVSFPVFVNPRTTAPEVFSYDEEQPQDRFNNAGLSGSKEGSIDEDLEQDSIVTIQPSAPPPPPYCTSKLPVWSLGITLMCQALGLPKLWPNLNVPQSIRKLLTVANTSPNVAERIAKEHGVLEQFQFLSGKLKDLIVQCLIVDPESRPDPGQLLRDFYGLQPPSYPNPFVFPTMRLRCESLNGFVDNEESESPALDALNLREIFYLWQLAGGDCQAELRKHGLVVNMPPVLNLPTLIVSKMTSMGIQSQHQTFGQVKDKSSLYDASFVTLDLSTLVRCLESLTVEEINPVSANGRPSIDQESLADPDTAALPLLIRERDVKYQFSRIVLYRKLLQSYPYMRPAIWTEARLDSLPLYRCFIWASLLGIDHDVQKVYAGIDKESWTPTDRQIEVDIPRCHQVSEFFNL